MQKINYKLIGLFLGLIFSWGLLIINVISVTLPNNPFRLIFGNSKIYTALVPEGWGFFTKNPRDPVVFTFIWENGKWVRYEKENNSSMANLAGLKRDARYNGVVFESFFKQLQPKDWSAHQNVDVNGVINQPLKPKVVKLATDYPDFCGKSLLFVQTKVIPWAWSFNEHGSSGIISYTCQVNVECN